VRFTSLGSGSEGNALLVESGSTRILIDCGFGLRDAVARLQRAGVEPEALTAIVVTHEHGDHIAGVAAFASRFGTTVWMTFGTLTMVSEAFAEVPTVKSFDSHDVLAIGDIEVRPFAVPHDAREPVQFVCSDGCRRLGVLTDLGTVTAHVEASLSGCDALVLECNHDLDMLWNGDYPPALKQRIAGRFGHIDNAAAAQLLARIDTSRLKHLIAAHLSRENNRPDLARAALAQAVHCAPEWIEVADQHRGFGWREFV
jgi:phosphoribosyl 1,2-cyclic phosphodiesterase